MSRSRADCRALVLVLGLVVARWFAAERTAAAEVAAVGLLLATRGRRWPFVLLDGAWFPRPPERFALPAGDFERAAPWNVSAIAGVSWGRR